MSNDFPILLAEDDDNDVFFFQRAVREANIRNELCVVRDGQEVMDYLTGTGRFADRAQYPLPCLLILDLKMPRKTGMEVLQWLRTAAPFSTLPVIVFSSSAQPEDIGRAYRLGANAFVVKPASIERRTELAHLIKGFWLHYNQPPLLCSESTKEISASG
jgi:CheY-like chemotaxis protein